jgi:hypothetical protein
VVNERLIELFQHQVESQCVFALMSFNDLNAGRAAEADAVAQLLSTDATRESMAEASKFQLAASNRVWLSLNTALTAVANISKLLWPVAGRKTAKQFPDRGEVLRASLGVPDDSPLQHRTVRNHFEHIDERFEEWWLKSQRHNIALRTVGPLGGTISGLEANELFEQFDPDRGVVAFQGHLFELQPIADEVSALLDRVRDVQQSRRSFPAWE